MKLSLILVSLVACTTTQAFTVPVTVGQSPVVLSAKPKIGLESENVDHPHPTTNVISPSKIALATTSLWTVTTELATAAGPDWGIFEGRTGSLLHPITMGGLFLYSAYTAFLGFQWRRQRTLGDEITQLKKTLPDMGGAASVAEAIAAAQEAGDSAKVAALQSARSTESEIASLQQERKDLAAAGPRDRHFAQGALLAFVGTTFAIEVSAKGWAREVVHA